MSGGAGPKLGDRITDHELRLLELVCRDGLSLRRAARELSTTYPAVANTAWRLRTKVGATTLAHLGHLATASGVIGTRDVCGRRAGVARHQYYGEELCVKCRIFWRPYRREIKRRAREKARSETKISGG